MRGSGDKIIVIHDTKQDSCSREMQARPPETTLKNLRFETGFRAFYECGFEVSLAKHRITTRFGNKCQAESVLSLLYIQIYRIGKVLRM